MRVITRFQKKSALYSHVLENPLILQNIFQQLDAKDAINLSITNAPFTKEVRFLDTLNVFLEEKKLQYEEDVKVKKCTQFCIYLLEKVLCYSRFRGVYGRIDSPDASCL